MLGYISVFLGVLISMCLWYDGHKNNSIFVSMFHLILLKIS